MKQRLKIVNSAVIIFTMSLLAGCKYQNPANIPHVDVDITINIFEQQYIDLQGVGGIAYVSGGSKGIVVYRVSIDQFNAYERHCPYDTENPCGKVSLDNNELYLVDNDCSGGGCGSRFNPINGSNVDGPAIYPLLQYNTAFDGGALLRIYN